jgi:hypothetical protein
MTSPESSGGGLKRGDSATLFGSWVCGASAVVAFLLHPFLGLWVGTLVFSGASFAGRPWLRVMGMVAFLVCSIGCGVIG